MPAFLVALIALGALCMVIVFGGLVLGAVLRGRGTPVDPLAVPLTQTYATPNGLLKAHYPADFVAKTLDDATLVVSRNFGGGEDEVVTLAAVKDSITNDPRELARLLDGLVEKNVLGNGGTYGVTARRSAQCLGSHPGEELEMTFKLSAVGPYLSRGCFFLVGTRGYELRYDVPKSRAGTEVALLQRIIAATELTP
jgi:hypothetical protein